MAKNHALLNNDLAQAEEDERDCSALLDDMPNEDESSIPGM